MPTAARARGRLLADHRQQRRRSFPYISDASARPAPARPRTRAACFADGGVLGRIPANRLYQTGLNILKMYPDAELSPCRARRYNYEITRPIEKRAGVAAGGPPGLSADDRRCARRSSTPAGSSRIQTFNGSIPGFNDTRQHKPKVDDARGDGQLHLQPDDVPRGDLRPQRRTS